MTGEALLYGAVRTAIGSFGGGLGDVPVTQLGATVITGSLERAGIAPEAVDEVIMGNVLQAGSGMNTARQAAVRAGIPYGTPAMTVNKVCGSGLKAVALAAQAVMLGDAGCVVAGGMENMSRAPFILDRARWGYRLGHGSLIDSIISEGLWDVFYDCHMGTTAEHLAKTHSVTREMQDLAAHASQMKAARAREDGRFAREIIPVETTSSRGVTTVFDTDEFIRPGTTPEILATLRPAFAKDGTVTAGNASGVNDGAAAVVVVSEDRARALGLPEPQARIVSHASAGVDPMLMGLGPVASTRKVLDRLGTTIDSMDLIECNEAFAVQLCAVERELGWDPGRVNVNGGAVALGHPIGASGARILVTLLHEMERRDSRQGLATLCIGGGQGIAMVVGR